MKTLSVLMTLALFVAANGLAVWLKHESFQPPPRKDMARVSKPAFHRVDSGTRAPRRQFYE
jgi:hypothetical protein